MAASFNFFAFVVLLGAIQAFLLALVLLVVKHHDAKRFLAALMLVLSLILGSTILYHTKYIFVYPHLARTHHPLVFVAWPLLFFYAKALIHTSFKLAVASAQNSRRFVIC